MIDPTTPEYMQSKEPTFSASFSVKVLSIATSTVGPLSGVVKIVECAVVGELAGKRFELPQTVTLADPDSSSFKALETLVESDVAAWAESAIQNMTGLKMHIQMVLDREVSAAAAEPVRMPWVPPEEDTPSPAPEV